MTLLPERQAFHVNSQAQPKLVFSRLQDSNIVPKSRKVTFFSPWLVFMTSLLSENAAEATQAQRKQTDHKFHFVQ